MRICSLVAYRRVLAILVATLLPMATLFTFTSNAYASIVPTVPLATARNYSVLGSTTVTNTGGSVLNRSVGLWPGSSVTGFPPGIVLPPATIDVTISVAQQAQSDLTTGYINAAGRVLNATVPADLAGQNLQGGVYAAAAKGPLILTGTLILDGAGNPDTVFIFQTDSTLITSPGSTISLINGAQECNVFWQVGSSATLDTGSTFVGNILALTSVSVNNGVTVHGRALARNAAVTLDNDVFTHPSCAGSSTETAFTGSNTTATTLPGGSASDGQGVPAISGPPRTGATPLHQTSFPLLPTVIFSLILGLGITGYWYGYRRRSSYQ